MSDLTLGLPLPTQLYAVTRPDLLRYASASGDDNPIHLSDQAARDAGLPGVIAHGMLTMGLAARALDTWAGGPGRVRDLACRFVKPLVVPDDAEGVLVRVDGTVTAVDDEHVTVELQVTCADEPVLTRAAAVLSVEVSDG